MREYTKVSPELLQNLLKEHKRVYNLSSSILLFTVMNSLAGFGGFFKGVGQGLVGVVVKPVSGVVDFASGTLDGVKK